jgi:hypothetical protein
MFPNRHIWTADNVQTSLTPENRRSLGIPQNRGWATRDAGDPNSRKNRKSSSQLVGDFLLSRGML